MAKVGRLVKDQMVQELTSALGERPNFFVTSIGRLDAVEADGLRKKLRSMRSRLIMVKRTLGVRGLTAVKTEEPISLLEGSVGFVVPEEDVLPVAKLIVEFAKAGEEKLAVRGGWIDGQLLDQRRVEQLASLPPKPQLIAELIGVLESPMSDLVFTIEQVLRDVPWVLDEVSKSRPAAAAAPGSAAPEAPAAPAASPSASSEPSAPQTGEPGGAQHA